MRLIRLVSRLRADVGTVFGEPTLPTFTLDSTREPAALPNTPVYSATTLTPPPTKDRLLGVSVITRPLRSEPNNAPTNLVASSSRSSLNPPVPLHYQASTASTTETFTNLSVAATPTPGTSLMASPTGSNFPCDIYAPGELHTIQSTLARRMIGLNNGVNGRKRRRHIYDRQVGLEGNGRVYFTYLTSHTSTRSFRENISKKSSISSK